MWLRVIGAGLGVAIAAPSVPANAETSCKSSGEWRSEGSQQTMRVDAKKDGFLSWVAKNRVFLVDGAEKDKNTNGLTIDPKAVKLWHKNLRYPKKSDDVSENQIKVYFVADGGRKSTTCTVTVETQERSSEGGNAYYARFSGFDCTGTTTVVDCERQYNSGSGRHDITLTLDAGQGGLQ